MNREQLVDEILMLLPALMRGLGRQPAVEREEIARRGISGDAHVSPGHVQVMVALSRGPHSVSQLADAMGVSPPAVTQIVDRLVELEIVERRHAEEDRRRVLVDYASGMQEIAHSIAEQYRKKLRWSVERMSDEEARAFLKGLKLLVEGLDVQSKEGA